VNDENRIRQNPVIRHTVKPLHRIYDSTIQRFNELSRQRHLAFFARSGFTLIELIVTVTIIVILTGLVLSTVGYVQKKAARSRAETEIAAISAACENYKADNGVYPRGQSTSVPPSGTPTYTVATSGTDHLNARVNTDSTQKIYQDTCRYLYEQLSGDGNLDLVTDVGKKSYFTFKESMLATIKDANGTTVGLSHIKDPFGNSYGYSTANQAASGNGYNPTFDLWSTVNSTDPNQWIKNW
jgi:prepilin-type N-terminal cleavage/methylation domain-containing protein